MDRQRIASWILPLVGHQFDLEDLPLLLVGQDVHVAPHEDMFVLVIPSAIIGDDYEPVRAFAEEQLELINGACRVLSSTFRPVSLAGQILGVDSAGNVLHTVVGINTLELRSKAGAVRPVLGGSVQPDPREGAASALIRGAMSSPRGRDALTIVGRPSLTWSELYLLYELVEADVGGQMFKLGWISGSDADLFSHTANSYNALRSSGRHGKDKGDAPAHPMPLANASTLIRDLVFAWLRHMTLTDDPPEAG